MAETKAIKKVGDGINLELDGISGGGGGGIELKKLEATVTLRDNVDKYVGGITSVIPENTEINDIIGIYLETEDNSIHLLTPLPYRKCIYADGHVGTISDFIYYYIEDMPAEYAQMFPLGLLFNWIEDIDGARPETLTKNIVIVYT